jgi:ABC-2 type transport system ATP-binding protein
VRAAGIRRRYGERVALDNFTVELPGGVISGLLGPNGSGKSTFLMLVASAARPESGELLLFGEPARAKHRARIGTMFQEQTLDPLMTPREHLLLAARLFGVPRSAAPARATELLAAVGLADRAGDRVSTLSGGMRRRVDLARALVHSPELLLLDEPTTGVDPGERAALWDAVRQGQDGARTVVLATNDLAEADALCDFVAFVADGRVVASGAPEDLKRGLQRDTVVLTLTSPAPAAAERFAAWEGVGEAVVDGDQLRIPVHDGPAFVPRAFEALGGEIRAVEIHRTTLADAYFHHVGRTAPRREAAS